MAFAYINPKMLTWARTAAEISRQQLLHEFDKLDAWEKGEQFPTFAQAETLASKLRIPLLVLFLTEPPPDKLPLPDLRTLKGRSRKKPSANFMEVIQSAIVRQDWYREEFPGAKPRISSKRFSVSDDVKTVAEYLRRTLWINDDLRAACPDWNEFLHRIVQNAETAGVLVMRSGVVKNDNRRKLNVEEFRGFALTDPIAPLVFINSNDTTTAQIFTLAHELAHLCIDKSGISNPDPTKSAETLRDQIEIFCNQVAAEVLVPTEKFNRAWLRTATDNENLKRIVRFFKVSNMVALRRAHDLGKINSKFFFDAIEADYTRFKKLQKKDDDDEDRPSGGPPFWDMFPVRNGRRFTEGVFLSLQGGRVAYTEAARLLGLRVPTLEAYARRRAA